MTTRSYFDETKKYKAEYGDRTVVLMQVGDFFECYGLRNDKDFGKMFGSNIEDIADICDLMIAKKNMLIDGCQLYMAGFNMGVIDKYIDKLQAVGYTVPIIVQDEQAVGTTRSLAYIVSPGTNFSTDNEELSNNIMCIWLYKSKANRILNEKLIIGLSVVDIFTGRTSMFQLSEDYSNYVDNTSFDELERYISMYNPNETIIVSNVSSKLITNIIKFTGLNSKKIHQITDDSAKAKKASSQIYQKEIISKFYSDSTISFQTFLQYDIATQSFVYLLDFVYAHNPALIFQLNHPIFENSTNRLILANHSLKQLNIIDDLSSDKSSVMSLLNNCLTKIGKRRFNNIIMNPVFDVNALEESYNLTSNIMEDVKNYRDILRHIKDIEKLNRKLNMKRIVPADFVILHDNLSLVEELYKTSIKNESLNDYIHKNSVDTIIECSSVIRTYISDRLDLTKCIDINTNNKDKLALLTIDKLTFVNTSEDNDFNDIINNSLSSLECMEQLESICQYFSDIVKTKDKRAKIDIHRTKTDTKLVGTVLRINFIKEYIKGLKNKIVTLDYKSNQDQSTKQFELDLSELSFQVQGNDTGKEAKKMNITSQHIRKIITDTKGARVELLDIMTEFYKNFVIDMLKFNEQFITIIKFIGLIDVIQNKAYIAKNMNLCKPNIVESATKAYVSFTGIRHCLIEKFNTNELYVTNDLSLGDDERNGVLLFGTNAIGKTSFIKSIGIAIVMAQAGLYVPCETFDFFPYRQIFTRILGNDDIFNGLSSFEVEMLELDNILRTSTENSLVLGDEMCNSTEMTSAISIFIAGLEELHQKKCSFIFATHFHEITKRQEIFDLEKLKLMHMTIKENQGKIVYDRKLKDGSGPDMYGLIVCRSLNMSSKFLERANQLRNEKSPLELKTTKYNTQKIKGKCEICQLFKDVFNEKNGEEIHHLIPQQKASLINNYIGSFHKNHPANLVNICQKCHDDIHSKNIEYQKVKTLEGYQLVEC